MVPKLRFKEFCGKWEEKTIGDILKIKHGKDQKGIEVANGKYPILGTGGVIGRTNTPICTWSCVLIGRKGTIDKPQYMDIPFWTVDTLFYSKSEKNNDPKYEFYLFQTINWMKYNEASGVPSLSAKTIQSIKVKVPSLPEQTKIADFLSTVDDKIQNQQDKITHLENIKKGFMQKIFSRKIRFKDDGGEEFPEWEEKKLGDTVDHYGGTALEKFVVENGTCKFISIGNYSSDGKYIDNGQRINPEGKAKEKKLNKNDLVMVLNDKTSNGTIIGSTILIHDNNYIYNQRSERLVCKNSILPIFMWCYINSPIIKNKILKLVQGGTQIYVNFSNVYNIKIEIPCLKEQQKIADFLSSFDEKISIEKEILEHLKQHKKGFLQQMFI